MGGGKFCLFLALFSILNSQKGLSQCSWDHAVCLTGCSDIWNGDGETLVCFDPSSTSPTDPATINYCYSDLSELWTVQQNPLDPNTTLTVERFSSFMLCIPDDICQASLNVFRVGIDSETGSVINTELIDSEPNVYTGTNRGTPCNSCPNGGHSWVSLPHTNILNSIGTYRIDLNFECCNESGQVIGQGSTSFYYELVNAASNVDVEIAFTASQEIENINNDPDIDGIITTDGSFPGPELGPASAGVHVSSVGNGIIDYTVEVFEMDCANPTAQGTLINSETIPYNGDQEIYYSFLNIPNWENIYDPAACYKVITRVRSVCGDYEEEAFFTITNQCTFCLINPTSSSLDEGQNAEPNFSFQNGEVFLVESEHALKDVYVLDEWGRVLNVFHHVNKRSQYLGQFQTSTHYILIVSITDSGEVYKAMIPNVK